MDLIDRYVQSVRFFLPAAERDDIGRELAANIRSEVQDKEAELGRSLGADEVSAILKRWGHPIVVSGRYRPERYLIGPALFPVYWFVLKLVTVCYLFPWLAVWIGFMVASPSYRTAHQGAAFFQPLSTWLHLVIWVIGITTVVFAILERTQARLFARWDPQGMPVVTDKNAIPRFSSILEIVVNVVFILWWTGNLHLPAFSDNEGRIGLTLTASFRTFFWPVLLQAVLNAVLAGANLFRPWWTIPRALVHLALNGATVVIAASMLRAGPWVEVSHASMAAPAAEVLTKAANLGLYWLFVSIAIIAFLVVVFEDGRRLYRLATKR